ncbi:MAG: hypothetical protein KME31_34295 [Tolypothrix carrinoi HA7290-LM1]|jgi:hypothetical protein|nr:hypothetical protein [Tolypothrix carrinoi HA7290-LM1]
MDIDRLTKKTQFSKTDWLSLRNIADNNLTFSYEISAEPNWQWWVLYRGVLPDGSDLKDKKEKQPNKKKEYWDWVPKENKEGPVRYDIKDKGKKGTVEFNDYKFTPGAIYTLALFKDETENAHDLAHYLEIHVPLEYSNHSDTLSNLKISEEKKTITFDYQISADKPSWQRWVLYRGVMPNDNLNQNQEDWKWVSSNETGEKGTISSDYDFKPGAIYTLALFKDETENAYDLADYYTFRVPPDDNTLSNLKTSENTITFDYQISATPDNQWWVLYRGVMPYWDDLNKNKEYWDWVPKENKEKPPIKYDIKDEGKKGTVSYDYKFTPGAIYTLALFKDEKENAYDLADYIEFSVATPWTVLVGENSYCYCACNSTADNKQEHNSSHTMNIEEGAPYFYAVLTKDDDTVDFPDGAVLTIEDPDGTKYDRNIQEENQLVIMSGSSVRCLVVKDPKPGDWKMTMTVPEGVGFHCECNTVPSKDPYKTITDTLSNTNQLQKRGKSVNETGWYGPSAFWHIVQHDAEIGAEIGAKIGQVGGAVIGGTAGTFVGGPLGGVEGAVEGAGEGEIVLGFFGKVLGAGEGVVRGVLQTSQSPQTAEDARKMADVTDTITQTDEEEQKPINLCTWNLQGANWEDPATSPWTFVSRWFTEGVTINNRNFKLDICCMQEVGREPDNRLSEETIDDINGFKHFLWNVGTLRRVHMLYVTYYPWEALRRGDGTDNRGRVNLAIISRVAPSKNLYLSGTWRPLIGINIGLAYYYCLHAKSGRNQAGDDVPSLIAAIERDPLLNFRPWLIAGDYNTEPNSLQTTLNESDLRVTIVPPDGPTHNAKLGPTSELDYMVSNLSQIVSMPGITDENHGFTGNTPQSDHLPVFYELITWPFVKTEVRSHQTK